MYEVLTLQIFEIAAHLRGFRSTLGDCQID